MPGKGKFSGFNWHHEFHTVDPKKEKAADCIYLSEDRICRNRSCIVNGEKCFVATHCRYRIKAEDAPKPVPKKQEWKCSLPPNCVVFSKVHGVGEYIGCDKTNHVISIQFDTVTKKYKYPDAFIEKHLVGNSIVDTCVAQDRSKDHER